MNHDKRQQPPTHGEIPGNGHRCEAQVIKQEKHRQHVEGKSFYSGWVEDASAPQSQHLCQGPRNHCDTATRRLFNQEADVFCYPTPPWKRTSL